jgi:hypothetical protein
MHNDRIAGTPAVWLRRAMFAVVLPVALALGACGGGGDDDNPIAAAPAPSNAPNAVTVTVAGGAQRVPNLPTVSVTVCAPGTSTCQTIDGIQVDTESFGLRVLASALSSSMAGALPVNAAAGGGTLAECVDFADGYMWGSVRTADVKLGGETASAIPIQVVGDLAASTQPQACRDLGAAQNSQGDLAANGLLGIGVAPTDCGDACALNAAASIYFACPDGANCTNTTVPLAQQVANPVARFAADNNGVILQLPAVPAGGAASVTGTLIFGIGTQANNAMNAAQRFATTAAGDLTATLNGSTVTAFLDSGSNGLFFADDTIAQCTGNFAGFYCPAQPLTRSVTLTGVDGASASVSFDVGNAQTLYGSGNLALNGLAGDFAQAATLDLGLPFFYGRSVYFGFDQTASGGPAPFVAF